LAAEAVEVVEGAARGAEAVEGEVVQSEGREAEEAVVEKEGAAREAEAVEGEVVKSVSAEPGSEAIVESEGKEVVVEGEGAEAEAASLAVEVVESEIVQSEEDEALGEGGRILSLRILKRFRMLDSVRSTGEMP
jgi:hypothetical protein